MYFTIINVITLQIMDEMYKRKPWVSTVLTTVNNASAPPLSEQSVDEEKTNLPSYKTESPSKRKYCIWF